MIATAMPTRRRLAAGPAWARRETFYSEPATCCECGEDCELPYADHCNHCAEMLAAEEFDTIDNLLGARRIRSRR